MSNDNNPFKDIFNLERLQNDSINLVSSLVRGHERNVNAIVECIQDAKRTTATPTEDTTVTVEDTSYPNYECPFPEAKRSKATTMDDMFDFPNGNATQSSNDAIDVDYVDVDTDSKVSEVGDTMQSSNPIDPFSTCEDTPLQSEPTTQETPTEKPKCNPIDPFSTPTTDTKPLTNRQVIDKTASMWKYNPIAGELERYPEYVTEKGSTPYAEIVASRVRGKKHKYNSTNCDDYYDFSLVGNCCVVGISDGAGSKAYSRVGAKESTTSYVRAMRSALETLLKDATFLEGLSYPVSNALFNRSCSRLAMELQSAVRCAYSSLTCRFEEMSKDVSYSEPLGRDLTIGDLSCTLLSAVIIPIETESGVETFVATLQVGDGLICSVDASKPFDGCTKVLGVSDTGNFSGETEFITANGMMEQANLMRRIKVMKGKTSAIILTTDGVADDYFPNESKACNLYNDLVLNGVVPIDVRQDSSIKIVPPIREQKTIEEIPRDVCVAYCEDIQEFFNVSDETVWNDRSFVENAVSVYGQCFSDDRAENLQGWLDNYTKRGSFDDRTLFLYRTLR